MIILLVSFGWILTDNDNDSLRSIQSNNEIFKKKFINLKFIFIHNYTNNSRHDIPPRSCFKRFQLEEYKRSSREKEEELAIFGTNISENKRNTDKALRYERVAIRMDEIVSPLFFLIVAPVENEYSFPSSRHFLPRAFSNGLSSIFYELAYIGSMPPREYFLQHLVRQ